jgi:hypothetical protein
MSERQKVISCPSE